MTLCPGAPLVSPSKFGGHKDCGSGDKMILFCDVIFQENMIKVLCDFIRWSPSR